MAIWLIRAGSHGQFEQQFIQEGRVYVTWDRLDVDLAKLGKREQLERAMSDRYPDAKRKTILNWVGQVWPFAHEISRGDLVALPLKSQPAVQFGEISGDYHFEASGPNPFFHWRRVHWEAEPVPRSNFGQDLLYSFGAFMTICPVQRNGAERRIADMRRNGWRPEATASVIGSSSPSADATDEPTDLEQVGRDGMAKLIAARFKGTI